MIFFTVQDNLKFFILFYHDDMRGEKNLSFSIYYLIVFQPCQFYVNYIVFVLETGRIFLKKPKRGRMRKMRDNKPEQSPSVCCWIHQGPAHTCLIQSLLHTWPGLPFRCLLDTIQHAACLGCVRVCVWTKSLEISIVKHAKTDIRWSSIVEEPNNVSGFVWDDVGKKYQLDLQTVSLVWSLLDIFTNIAIENYVCLWERQWEVFMQKGNSPVYYKHIFIPYIKMQI